MIAFSHAIAFVYQFVDIFTKKFDLHQLSIFDQYSSVMISKNLQYSSTMISENLQYSSIMIFEVGKFGRKRFATTSRKRVVLALYNAILKLLYALRDGQVAVTMFVLLSHLTSECCPAAYFSAK
jgi:hypothetical protein